MHKCAECGQDSGLYGICGSCFVESHIQEMARYREDMSRSFKELQLQSLAVRRVRDILREDPNVFMN